VQSSRPLEKASADGGQVDSSPADESKSPAKADVVILGAGPCGLYAALTLAKAGRKVTLLEKEEVTGGLARGHRRGENFYDLGCHMLHAFDKEVFDTVSGIMGDERIEVPLNATIKWAGAFYRYPLQFGDMVKGMPKLLFVKCSLGLLWYQLLNKINPKEPVNAEEALIQLYGKPLYLFFFKEFTHRYWGFPPTELSATFITTKMPRLSAVDVVKKVLAKFGIKERKGRAVESALAEETLHYSRTGAEGMARCLANEIERLGCRVVTQAEVFGVKREGRRIVSVSYRDTQDTGEGKSHDIACEQVISTIPIGEFVTALGDLAPEEIRTAASNLRIKPIAVYGLLVKKAKAINSLYIYYRDRCFHRVGEPKNAGLTVNPPDHTVLIIETTCEIGDEKWNGEQSFIDRIAADLEDEGICGKDEIVETHVLQAKHGYPVFSLGFEPHLEAVQAFVASLENVRSVGRQGGFCYPNMHSAMRMGADAAAAILKQDAKLTS